MNNEIKPGQKYRHFKGYIATVITVAKHTESQEDLVVYECDSSNVEERFKTSHENIIYARPIEMFFSKVDHDKYPDVKQKYRFELIEEEN